MPWFRTVSLATEIPLLAAREHEAIGSIEHARRHEKAASTRLAAFQYLESDTEQMLFSFGEEDIGILCSPNRNRTVYWRDSSYCAVSDEIFKRSLTKVDFKAGLERYRFKKIEEEKVSQAVRETFDALRAQYQREGFPVEDAQLAWTEGLFRYKLSEIDFVVINPDNAESSEKGVALALLVHKFGNPNCRLVKREKASQFTIVNKGRWDPNKMDTIYQGIEGQWLRSSSSGM